MNRYRGVTLTELVVLVAILAIVAVVALPQLASTDPARLDAAARQVADALDYARNEAMRTGQPHGVLIDHDGSDGGHKDYTVYRVDTAISPFGIAAVDTNPVDKQTYDRSLSDSTLGIRIHFDSSSAPFAYSGIGGRQQHIHFDPATGQPVLYWNGSPARLTDGTIKLTDGHGTRTLSVQPINGQVLVQ